MAMAPEKQYELELEMEKRKVHDTAQAARAKMERKHKFSDFNRLIYTQEMEKKTEENEVREKYEEQIKQRQLEQDEQLALEMSRLKSRDLGNLKKRQLLRESPELKEFERKIRQAYTNKVLVAQIEEKRLAKLAEKIQEKEHQQILEQARMSLKEYNHIQKQNSIMQKHKYKQELQDQMIFLEKTKRFQYDQFLREKKFLDEVVERINDEDRRQMEIKYMNKLKTLEDVKAFKACQEEWKKRAKQQVEEEDRKIQEYIKAKVEAEQKSFETKAQKEALHDKICDDMARKIYSQRKKEDEKRQIIDELNEEEMRVQYDKQMKEKMEREFRSRIEVLGVLLDQMKDKTERERQQFEEDKAYQKQLMAKFAEDNRLELLSKEKKRIKLINIKKDIEQMINDQRIKRAEEMEAELQLDKKYEKEMEERNKLIEEERIRILQEHAIELIGYMPRGVMTEKDLKHLSPEAEEKWYCHN